MDNSARHKKEFSTEVDSCKVKPKTVSRVSGAETVETYRSDSSRIKRGVLTVSVASVQRSHDQTQRQERRCIGADSVAPLFSPGTGRRSKKGGKRMENPVEKCFVGVDWGDREHAVCVVDAAGRDVAVFSVPHTAEGLEAFVSSLREHGPLEGVAVETSRHLLVQKLMEAGFVVFPVNPKVSQAWRAGWSAAAGKTDVSDARVLADGLRQHHRRMRALHPDEARTRELAMLCADENRLVAERTALVNRLRATLKEYFPAALEWFDDWTAPTAWDFVLTFPKPDVLLNASRKRLFGFLKSHRIGLSSQWQERVERRGDGVAWPADVATVAAKSRMAVAVAKQLRALEASLVEYRKRIEELFAEHPDADIFSSLPGAGPKLAPQLLSHFGSRRDNFKEARALQQLSGVVPVTEQSGARSFRRFRRACRKDFRNTMYQFALQSIRKSAWARAFYDEARRKGQSHALASRNLAAKWIKIIYRMWLEHESYDEHRYLISLEKRNSPLFHLLKEGV